MAKTVLCCLRSDSQAAHQTVKSFPGRESMSEEHHGMRTHRTSRIKGKNVDGCRTAETKRMRSEVAKLLAEVVKMENTRVFKGSVYGRD